MTRVSEPQEHLLVEGLSAWYGESQGLHGVSFSARRGECVSLVGRNGAGKTTTLRAIMGITVRRSGSVRISGTEVLRMPPHRIARLGVGYCPEERGMYGSLSCQEALLLPPVVAPGGMALEQLYELFPNLAERRNSSSAHLSGGEQQMLAIARILRTGARLLLLDEISEGLAPVIVDQLEALMHRLKADGFTIVLVEQNLRFVEALADRSYVVEHGRVVATVAREELAASEALLASYLSV